MTHFLDDHPIETHVFVSLQLDQDLYVLTESAMWGVGDGTIRLLMDGEDYRAYLDEAEAGFEERKD